MYQRILVPIDGSRTSARGLEEAIGLARGLGARLRLVRVLEELSYSPGASNELLPLARASAEELLDAGRRQAELAGLAVQTVLLAAHPEGLAELLLAQARHWQADLLVLGSHGRRGVRRLLLGSTAEQLARLSPLPVLLVRGIPPAT